MAIFLIILIAIISVLLALVILIQNPKGGGVGASVGGFGSSFSNQFGVKQAANILEKATYVFIASIALLAILSVYVISSSDPKPASEVDEIINAVSPAMPASAGGSGTENVNAQPQTAPPATNTSTPSPLPSSGGSTPTPSPKK